MTSLQSYSIHLHLSQLATLALFQIFDIKTLLHLTKLILIKKSVLCKLLSQFIVY